MVRGFERAQLKNRPISQKVEELQERAVRDMKAWRVVHGVTSGSASRAEAVLRGAKRAGRQALHNLDEALKRVEELEQRVGGVEEEKDEALKRVEELEQRVKDVEEERDEARRQVAILSDVVAVSQRILLIFLLFGLGTNHCLDCCGRPLRDR